MMKSKALKLLILAIAISVVAIGCQSKEEKQANKKKAHEVDSTWLLTKNRSNNDEQYKSVFSDKYLNDDKTKFKSSKYKTKAYNNFKNQNKYEKEKAQNETVAFDNKKVKTDFSSDSKLQGGYDADVNKNNSSEQYEQKEQGSLKTMLSDQIIIEATLMDGKRLDEATYDIKSDGSAKPFSNKTNHKGYTDTPLATQKVGDGYQLWKTGTEFFAQSDKATHLKGKIPKNGGLLHIKQKVGNQSIKAPKISDLAQISAKGKQLKPVYVTYKDAEAGSIIEGDYDKYKDKKLRQHPQGKLDLYVLVDDIKTKDNQYHTTSKVHVDAPFDKTIYSDVKFSPFEADKFETGKND